MKKRLWALILCLVLVCSCFAGCGKDKESENVNAEDKVSSEFKAFAAKLVSTEKAETGSAQGNSEEVGGEINVSLSIGEQIAAAYGLAGLENIGMQFSFDSKTAMKMVMDVVLNGAAVLSADVYMNDTAMYMGMPKYSDSFASFSLEEIFGTLGNEYFGESSSAAAGMPDAEEFAALWSKYSDKFIECFEYSATEKDVTAGTGDFTFTADKYMTRCNDPAALQTVLEELEKELEQYPSLAVEKSAGEMDFNSVQLNYYEGKNDQYVWEFVKEEESTVTHTFFASAEKGMCFYGFMNEEEPEILFYCEKESDTKGKLVLLADEEYVIYYDNYTDHSLELSGEISDIDFTMAYEKKDDSFTIDFTAEMMGFELTGKLEGGNESALLALTLNVQGIEFGSLTMEVKTRAFKDFEMPANGVDVESWAETIDQNAFLEDLQKLLTDFPFLANLIFGSEALDGIIDNDAREETPDDDREAYVPGEDYSDAFMHMTGYTVDEDGYVDFNPNEAEVLALGIPSTAYDTIPVTDEQKQALIDFVAGAFEDPHYSEETYYYVFGSTVYDSVQSYYSTSYESYEREEFGNSLELVFDAVNGELVSFTSRNLDGDKAVSMFNELLKAAGIDYEFTADQLGEYIYEGNMVISSYQGDGTSLSLLFYED